MHTRLKFSVLAACSCLLVFLVVNQVGLRVRASQASTSVKKQMTIKESLTASHTTAALADTGISTSVKLCSGVLAPNWRDTITVPDSWKAGTCQGFASSIGTSAYQLGCANPDNFSWGNPNGGTPPDNRCNW
jgi:hypothetical protein